MRKYTDEQVNRCIEMYKAGEKVEFIARETGISRGSIAGIVKLHGAQPRRTRSKRKICKSCGTILDHRANFCSNCGASLKTREELLLDDVKTLRGLCMHLPEAMRLKAEEITKKIACYITEENVHASK